MKRASALFLLGVAIGLVGGLVFPGMLPQSWRLALGSVEGTVESEQLEGGRLLLTLSTSNGVTLARFTKNIEEIDLLVELGDRVTLAARSYRPFLEDPAIAKVERPALVEPAVEAPAEPSRVEAPIEDAEESTAGGEEVIPAEEGAEDVEPVPESQDLDGGTRLEP